MKQDYPIGFFDSGSGGISVLAEFCRIMPHENCVYFGDHAHLPYGEKPAKEIRTLTLKGCDMLADQGIKALVVACNTASTAALSLLQKRYAFPVVGIEPPLAEANLLSNEGKVLVMATPATIKSDRFHILAAPYHGQLIPLPCPGLAEAVEAEDIEMQATLLHMFFHRLDVGQIGSIALGCTHYPLIKNTISHVLNHQVPILDGYTQLAFSMQERLDKAGLLNASREPGRIVLSTSGDNHIKTRLQRVFERQTSITSLDNQDSF